MRKALLLLILTHFTVSFLWSQPLFKLDGDFIQGGLIRGHTKEIISSILFNGEELTVSDSSFVFGFAMNDPYQHTLIAVLESGEKLQVNLTIADYNQGEIDSITVVPEMIDPPKSPELIKRLEEEYYIKRGARKALVITKFPYFSVIQRPVVGGRITTNFGAKRVYNGWKESVHTGVDIARGTGINVRAMADGMVSLIGDFYYSGNFVFVDHGLGLSSEYFHLSKQKVTESDLVTRNQILGEVGSTGRSTGPHLHWQSNWFDKKLNPLFLIDEISEVREYKWVE